MRILIITQRWYPDTFGGSEHVASEQARRLAARGHAVTVITGRLREVLPTLERQGNLQIYRYGSPAEFEKFGGETRAALKEVPRLIYEIQSPKRRRLDLPRWDAAILHHPFPAYGFFKARLRLPALYIFHASAAKEMELEGIQRKLPRALEWLRRPMTQYLTRWAGRLEKKVLSRSSVLAVFSEFSRTLLRGLDPALEAKTTRLSVGIEQELFHPAAAEAARAKLGLAQAGPLLITVRRFSPRMGIITLIQAMASVRSSLRETRLLIVGEGPLHFQYQKEISARQLQGAVTLVGPVPLPDLPLYYQAADLFVLPTEAFEGLGMATLEALSCGVPVLGTPVGATSEMLRDLDPRLLTRGTSAADIAQGIIEFLTRPLPERAELGSKARKLVEEKYNWENAIAELESRLKKLVT